MTIKEKLKNTVPHLPVSIGYGSVPASEFITEWLVDGEVVHVGESWTLDDPRYLGKPYAIRVTNRAGAPKYPAKSTQPR